MIRCKKGFLLLPTRSWDYQILVGEVRGKGSGGCETVTDLLELESGCGYWLQASGCWLLESDC